MAKKASRVQTRERPEGEGGAQRSGVRVVLTSTRFIASLFWLTIVVATMVFVLPYTQRSESPAFYAFVALSILVFLAHRYFPYEGYHPVAFFLLLMATNALVAVMVYLTGGSSSSMSLLFLTLIIFSSAYCELPETMLITAFTCAVYFAPLLYEELGFETLKSMAMAVPIYFMIALCGFFVISKAREQEREKQDLSYLFDQADSKRRELSTLYSVSLKFASTLDQAELLDILLDSAGSLVEGEAMAVCLVDASGRLSGEGWSGLDRDRVELLMEGAEDNPLYVSASAVLPVVLRDRDEDPRFSAYLEKVGFTSMIAVPLYASSSVIGVLSCFSHRGGAFDDDAARLLLTLASEAALALEKAALYQTTLQDKTKIEAIINSLTDGLVVLDREGRVALANPFISRLMGIEARDYGTYLSDLLERPGYGMEFKEIPHREALRRVLEGGESIKDECVMDGQPPIIFQVFWVPLADNDGRVNGAVILLHDVTDFVELDRMKSEFISIVSHELKTPLTSIKGFVRLLAAERVGPITEKQRHYLDIVLKQTESLTALINDLLDLSRIEAGIMEVKHEPVRLSEVVEGVLQQLDNMAQEKGISIAVDVPADLPELDGDGERLGQVFMNLIHNAIKFTPEGGEVRIKASSLGKDCLVMVADNGIGIAAQDLPRIFDKFYQVDASSTRQQRGTGLGLAISRQLVAAHGGELWVKSAMGKGTTFSMLLPFRAQAATPQRGDPRALGEAATG